MVAEAVTEAAVRSIPLELLVPREDQPRQEFGAQSLEALALSIRTEGVRVPLQVRPLADGRFDLLAGQRRLRAAQMAGLEEVPCLVRELDDREARFLVLLDNLQRENLLPWEEGAGYRQLLHAGMSPEEVAASTGHTRSYVLDRVSLTTLPDEVLERFRRGQITLSIMVAIAQRMPERPQPAPHSGAPGAQAALMDAPAVDLRIVAAQKAAGLPAEAARKITDALAVEYRLPGAPVQHTLAAAEAVERLPVATVQARSELDARLARIGALREWAITQAPHLGHLGREQKDSIRQQLAAAHAALNDIARAVNC